MDLKTLDPQWHVHFFGVLIGAAAAALFPVLLPPDTAPWDVLRYTANLYGAIGLCLGLVWPSSIRWHWIWWLGLPLLAAQGVGGLLGHGAIWARPDLERLFIALFTGGVGSQFGSFIGSKLRPGSVESNSRGG